MFVNTRYRHHRNEWADYVTVRRGLGLIRTKDEPPVPREATDVLARRGADHLAVHSGTSDTPGLRMYAQAATRLLYQWWGEWSVWYLDGHTTVFGWRPVGTGGAPEGVAQSYEIWKGLVRDLRELSCGR